ncbi:MAG: GNAT family N-acetyltransferase [Firmicutes bacterium]|nr:GNAT family N-acetyltransferase [Bacillota bacterium]MBQ4371961.1 GNAT family N-acetyltransferase [Bacillota bacterium]
MHCERLTTADDPDYPLYMKLYNASFPFHEQREPDSQEKIMRRPEYRFDRLYDGPEFIGLVLNWESELFIYVEHLCILPAKRGLGYGQRALRLLSERGKQVILEIDPPVDDISIRRRKFYEHAGFRANSYAHVHPPYHTGYDGHELVVMSFPRELTPEEYESFFQFLCETVMRE